MINSERVGAQIAALRKEKQLTQSELGERLHTQKNLRKPVYGSSQIFI